MPSSVPPFSPPGAGEARRRYCAVVENIAHLAATHGRDAGAVRLVAVGKLQPAAAVAAVARFGQRDVGENYLQEGLAKMAEVERILRGGGGSGGDGEPDGEYGTGGDGIDGGSSGGADGEYGTGASDGGGGDGGDDGGSGDGGGGDDGDGDDGGGGDGDGGGAGGLIWHFIGHIQSRKCRAIAEHFDWVHSVDSVKIADKLNQYRLGAPLNILIQLNLDDPAKSGVSPAGLAALAAHIASLPRLRLRGLMLIPRADSAASQQRTAYRECRRQQQRLCATGLLLDHLSMGMSGDLDAAIAEGATLVRVGTALFGPRPLRVG